jgi:predicted nucleic acid binding AN1-type Zn finger protein
MSYNYDDDEFDLDQLLKIIASSAEEEEREVEPPATAEVLGTQVNTSQEPAKRPKRCQMDNCKMKLLLTDSACKCQSFFCKGHRHAETHKCTFDFKKAGGSELQSKLIPVKGSKLEKI